jgi:Uncharacterised nucleotidyltransferase
VSASLSELGPGERRLLLACARVELDPGDEGEVADLLHEPLDWDALVSFARLHSVAPLLHRHLNRLADPDLVPAPARRLLLALAHRAEYQNRIFARENAELAAELDAAGVPVIVPKGLSLVELVYGDLGLRPLIDLLFMVPRGRLEEAGRVVVGRGFSAMRVRPPHAAYQWLCPSRWYLREDGLPLLVLLKAEVIDNPPRRHRFTSDVLWRDARPASVSGRTVFTLAPVDQVLYLCLQADGHGSFNRAALGSMDPAELLFAKWSNNRLVRFVDIHEVIRHHRRDLDWDRVVARARSCGIDDAAHASLVLADRLLGAAVPAEVLDALSGSPRPRVRKAMLGAVATPPGRSSPRGILASGWEGLDERRRKEVLRLVGLLEVAFPGLRALRAEHETGSAPKLLGIAALQAATTVTRSVGMFLRATRRGQDGPRWPTPTGSGRSPARTGATAGRPGG